MYSPSVVYRPTSLVISPGSYEALGGTWSAGLGSGTWPAANRALYYPFTLVEPMTAMKMWVSNGSAISGLIDVGIYNADTLSRLVSIGGATSQTGTSVLQEFDITDTLLQPGRYLAAMVLDNNVGTTIRATSISTTSMKPYGWRQEASAFALPSTATPSSAISTAYWPLFGVAFRSLLT